MEEKFLYIPSVIELYTPTLDGIGLDNIQDFSVGPHSLLKLYPNMVKIVLLFSITPIKDSLKQKVINVILLNPHKEHISMISQWDGNGKDYGSKMLVMEDLLLEQFIILTLKQQVVIG